MTDAAREAIIESAVASQRMARVPATRELAEAALDEALRLPLRRIG